MVLSEGATRINGAVDDTQFDHQFQDLQRQNFHIFERNTYAHLSQSMPAHIRMTFVDSEPQTTLR